MGNYCAGTSSSCAAFLDSNVGGSAFVDCANTAYASVCANNGEVLSRHCIGDTYQCQNLPGSLNDLCSFSDTGVCDGPGGLVYAYCDLGLECRLSGFNPDCGKNVYRCYAPTASPTKSPTWTPTKSPTYETFQTVQTAIAHRGKHQGTVNSPKFFLGEFAGGTLVINHEMYQRQSDNFFKKSASALPTINVLDSDITNVGITGLGLACVANSDVNSFTQYQVTQTASPTFAPSVAPTGSPTGSPTFDKSRVRVEVTMFEYVEALGDFDDMSRWIEFDMPEFYSGDERLAMDVTFYDKERSYTAWLPTDEKRVTHMTVRYRVIDENALLTKDTFIFRTRIFNVWDGDYDAFNNVRRITIVADQIDCNEVSSGIVTTKWDGKNSEPYCQGGNSWSGSRVCIESGKAYFAQEFSPLEFGQYPTCFYVDDDGEFRKIPNSVAGAGLEGEVVVQIEGSAQGIDYAHHDVPPTGTNNEDVVLTLTNWDYSSAPLVLGSVRAFDEKGFLIKVVKPEEVTVLQGSSVSSPAQPYCRARRAEFDPSCTVFGQGNGCCVIGEYDDPLPGKCVGELLVKYTGALQLFIGCDQICARDEDCVAVDEYIDQTTEQWECNLYRRVKAESIESFTGHQCYISQVPRSVFRTQFPIGYYENDMMTSYYDCTGRTSSDYKCYNTATGAYLFDAPEHKIARTLAKLQINLPKKTTKIAIDMGSPFRLAPVQGDFTRLTRDRSAVYYEVTQGGVPLDIGEHAPRPYWDSSVKYLHLKKIDGEMNTFLDLERSDSSVYPLYNVVCDEGQEHRWWNRSALIRNIVTVSGVDMFEVCDEATSAFLSADVNEFERVMGVLKIRLQDSFNEMGIDLLPSTIVGFESNDPAIEATREVFSAIVEIMHALDLPVQCRSWEVPYNPERVALELFYEYTFADVYKAVCKKGQDVQYQYQDKTYQRGMGNAPCVSNAQCKTGYACTSWKCTKANETGGLEMCEADSTLIQPDYYGLVPPSEKLQACAYEEVYTEESTYNDLYDYEDADGWKTFSFEDSWSDNKCPIDEIDRENVPLTYFRDRGNEQECYFYGSDELYDWGFSFRRPVWGFNFDTCSNTVASTLWNDYRGYYDRIIPHRPRTMGQLADATTRGAGMRSPSVFAFKEKDGLEDLMDALDVVCSYIPGADWTTQVDELEEECNLKPECTWHDALRKCVASRTEAEKHICVFIDDDVQCRLSGFCKWADLGNGAQCYHNSDDTDLVTEEEIKASVCPNSPDQVSCATNGCVWDNIVGVCLVSNDEAMVGNDLHKLVGSFGAADKSGRENFRRVCADKRQSGYDPVIVRYGNGGGSDSFNRPIFEVCLDRNELNGDEASCEIYGFYWDGSSCVLSDEDRSSYVFTSAGPMVTEQYGTYKSYVWVCKGYNPISWPVCTEKWYQGRFAGQPGNTYGYDCFIAGSEICKGFTSSTIEVVKPTCITYTTQTGCEAVNDCSWIPNAETCIFDKEGSSNYYREIYNNMFYMPPKSTRQEVLNYYNKTIGSNFLYDWNAHLDPWDMPDSVRDQAYSNIPMCDIDSMEECRMAEYCQWNYDEFKCEPHRCSYFPLIYTSDMIDENIKGHQRGNDMDDLMFSMTRSCKRLLGCEEDMLTLNCVNADQESRTWPEIVAEDTAFCSAMYDEFDVCDYQVAGRKNVCLMMGGFCVSRYPVYSSMTYQRAGAMVSRAAAETDSTVFLGQFYTNFTDTTFNPTAEVVTAQMLDGDEVYYLGGIPFYESKVIDLNAAFPQVQVTTPFPTIEFVSIKPGWPQVMTQQDVVDTDMVNLDDITYYIDDIRTQNNVTSPRQELMSQMMQEAVDRHRRNSVLVARTLMNSFNELDLIIRMDSEFVWEQKWWPNAKDDMLQMYIGALEELIGEEEAATFIDSIANGDRDLENYETLYSGGTKEDRKIKYTQNMIQALLTANTIEYMEREFNPAFSEEDALTRIGGAFAYFFEVSYDEGFYEGTADLLGHYLVLIDFMESSKSFDKLLKYFDGIDEPKVLAKFSMTRNVKYTEEVTKTKLVFQKSVKINKVPQSFFKTSQVTNTLQGHQSKWVLAAKYHKPTPTTPNFNVAPKDQVPNKTPIKNAMKEHTKTNIWRGSGSSTDASVNMHSKVKNQQVMARVKARKEAAAAARAKVRAKQGKPPLKNSLKKTSKTALQTKKKVVTSSKKLANTAKITKHLQSNVARSRWVKAMFSVHSQIPTETIKVTDTAATLSRKFDDFGFTKKLDVVGIQRVTEKITKVKKVTTNFAVVTKVTRVQKMLGKVAHVLKAVRYVGKVLGPIGILLDVIQLIQTIIAYAKAASNPSFCKYVEEFSNRGNVLEGLRSGRFWKPLRVFFGDESDILVGENKCSQRASYAMYDADGRYGFVDGRYDVPQCDGNWIKSMNMDYHFSDPNTGMNKFCTKNSQCLDPGSFSTIGKCIMGRCVFPYSYVGMKVCKKKVDQYVAPISSNNFNHESMVPTNYMRAGIPQKWTRSDPLLDAQNLGDACRQAGGHGNTTRFTEVHWNRQTGVVAPYVICFDDCSAWEKNDNMTKETYMLKMDETEYKRGQDCTSTSECDTGEICVVGGYCHGPVECAGHVDCFGAWFPPGRLPICNPITLICEDGGPTDCVGVDECLEDADDVVTNRPTASPTATQTYAPTVSPTDSPTKSPTLSICSRPRSAVEKSRMVDIVRATDFAINDKFGTTMEISAGWSVVGAPLKDDSDGAAYIFRNEMGVWTQKVKLAAPESGQEFGKGVAIHNDVVAVSSLGENRKGKVYVYYRFNDTYWPLKDILEGSFDEDLFGEAVSINGDRIVVGSPYWNNIGKVDVFQFDSVKYNLMDTVVSPQPGIYYEFGKKIDFEGSRFVVGEPRTFRKRADSRAHVYRDVGGNQFVVEDTLQADVRNKFSGFGAALAIDNNTIVVGAPNADVVSCNVPNAGVAYVFYRNLTDPIGSWYLHQQFIPAEPKPTDDFAASVDISGDIIVVGAKTRFDSAGAAYVYRRTARRRTLQETDPTVGEFEEDVELFDDSTINLQVGEAVAVDGETIAITSPQRDDSGVVYLVQANSFALATNAPTDAPSVSPTLSPTTSSPTLSPTGTGPLSGGGCNFAEFLFIDCQGAPAAIDELGGKSNITNPFNSDFCVELCRHDDDCVAVTYDYSVPGATVCRFVSTVDTQAFVANNLCYDKDIPCIPTASPTKSPTVTNFTYAPTGIPTGIPTGAPTGTPTATPTSPPTDPAYRCTFDDYASTSLIGYDDPNNPNMNDVGGNLTICLDDCSSSEYCVGFNYAFNKCQLFGHVDGNFTDFSSQAYLKNDPLCATQAVPTRFPTIAPTYRPTGSPTTKNPTGTPTIGNFTSTPTQSPTAAGTGAIPCEYNVTQDTYCLGGTVNSTLSNVGIPTQECTPLCNADEACTFYTHFVDTCTFYTNGTVTNRILSIGATCHVKIYGCGQGSRAPTLSPTDSPTTSPSVSPSVSPTDSPTTSPSAHPSANPTENPTVSPSASPTVSHEASSEVIFSRRPKNFITRWPPIILAITYAISAFAATAALVLGRQYVIPAENVIFRLIP